MEEAEDQQPYITIARLLRPRGNRGELVAEDLSDDPARFFEIERVFVRDASKTRRQYDLERAWHHKGRLILKFRGVDSISGAEALRDCDVQLPQKEIGPPPEGSFFFEDLIGCEIFDAEDGRRIGRVEEILEPGGPLLLQVDADGREVLIPFVRNICVEIAPERKTIRVRMPEGLEELNP